MDPGIIAIIVTIGVCIVTLIASLIYKRRMARIAAKRTRQNPPFGSNSLNAAVTTAHLIRDEFHNMVGRLSNNFELNPTRPQSANWITFN